MPTTWGTLLLFLLIVFIEPRPASCFQLEWRLGTKEVCQARECDSNNSTLAMLCSSDAGFHIPFGARSSSPQGDANTSCTYGDVVDNRYYNSTQLLTHLGENAVVAFLGDSVTRNLLHTFLKWLGPEYDGWYQHLQELSRGWEGDYRNKMDHTYLCSPPLGPNNLTVAFFWRNHVGMSVSRVPWVHEKMPGKFGKCVWWENGSGMQHCDSAHNDGRMERWQCTDTLDSVQLAGRPKRSFILVASAAAHTAMEEIHGKRNLSDPDDYLEKSRWRFEQAWHSMEDTKPFWQTVTQDGGRNIFFLPLMMKYGLPRTTNADHVGVNAMNHILGHHLKDKLRGRSNLTCEHGLEIIETDQLTMTPFAPGPSGDGVHYSDQTNTALIQVIVERIIMYNASNWRTDALSWNQTTNHLDNSC